MLIPQVLTSVTTLHELVEINYQRVMACELALSELNDAGPDHLAPLFNIDKQCHEYINELSKFIPGYAESSHDRITSRNVLNSIWNNLKSKAIKKDTRTLLTYCIFCEEAAQKTYLLFLNNEFTNQALKQLVNTQLKGISTSRININAMSRQI